MFGLSPTFAPKQLYSMGEHAVDIVGIISNTYSNQRLAVFLSRQAKSRMNERGGLPSPIKDRKSFCIRSDDQMEIGMDGTHVPVPMSVAMIVQ